MNDSIKVFSFCFHFSPVPRLDSQFSNFWCLAIVTFHTCPIPLQDVQWTFECPLDISVRPLDEWTFECPLDISVCPMDEWTFECRMDISVRPLVEWTYECPMDISVRPMVKWTFVYVQWTLLIFNTKYDNAGNAFCLFEAIMN